MKPGATTSPRASISRLRGRAGQPPDGNDAIAAHADVPRKPRIAGAVDNVAVAYQQVVRRLLPSQLPPARRWLPRGTPPGIRIEASWPCSSYRSAVNPQLERTDGDALRYDDFSSRLRAIGLEHLVLASCTPDPFTRARLCRSSPSICSNTCSNSCARSSDGRCSAADARRRGYPTPCRCMIVNARQREGMSASICMVTRRFPLRPQSVGSAPGRSATDRRCAGSQVRDRTAARCSRATGTCCTAALGGRARAAKHHQ